jgi:peptide deformylase
MAELLQVTRFGNPILRRKAKRLIAEEILSLEIQSLIENIRFTVRQKSYGVGLAAPQVGHGIALSVIGIKPTPNRPELESLLFAQLPRYRKVKLRWLDQDARSQEAILDGFVAQVVQHETDHLNGILFVDHVTDPTTFMMADEYRKRVLGK